LELLELLAPLLELTRLMALVLLPLPGLVLVLELVLLPLLQQVVLLLKPAVELAVAPK